MFHDGSYYGATNDIYHDFLAVWHGCLSMYTALVRTGYTTSINLFFLILYISDISDPFIFPQTLNIQTDGGKKSLTFIPLAPACVVSTNLSLSLPLFLLHSLLFTH